jgi:hypothetical protein
VLVWVLGSLVFVLVMLLGSVPMVVLQVVDVVSLVVLSLLDVLVLVVDMILGEVTTLSFRQAMVHSLSFLLWFSYSSSETMVVPPWWFPWWFSWW